jgi:hypothetical protein
MSSFTAVDSVFAIANSLLIGNGAASFTNWSDTFKRIRMTGVDALDARSLMRLMRDRDALEFRSPRRSRA